MIDASMQPALDTVNRADAAYQLGSFIGSSASSDNNVHVTALDMNIKQQQGHSLQQWPAAQDAVVWTTGCMHQHRMYGMHIKVCSPIIIVYRPGVLLDGNTACQEPGAHIVTGDAGIGRLLMLCWRLQSQAQPAAVPGLWMP
jgi:hypothetical protein